ncbi:hypothetical protein G3I40_04405, partial [Streptomyces sp. SID14478]|nr:hypothetical protein [Streptomyces sp. SID14478]
MRHTPPSPTRRTLLGASLAVAGTGVLTACSDSGPGSGPDSGSGHGAHGAGGAAPAGYVDPAGEAVAA